eukprot:2230684-Prymnesium_polylepis.1
MMSAVTPCDFNRATRPSKWRQKLESPKLTDEIPRTDRAGSPATLDCTPTTLERWRSAAC